MIQLSAKDSGDGRNATPEEVKSTIAMIAYTVSTLRCSDEAFPITIELASKLVAHQFPRWAELPIQPVVPGGWDNRTFRLGDDFLIRIPSAAAYRFQIEKEQKWLPKLQEHLSYPIPAPVELGKSSTEYPWKWSIYRWIEGETVKDASISDKTLLASDLAQALKELHTIDVSNGPEPGTHNFYRGAHPLVYDQETRHAIQQLSHQIDVALVTSIWEKAISSKWTRQPVWVHGDLAPGNILIRNERFYSLIDFGCMAVGDPSCDLVMAWTFFEGRSRSLFQSLLPLDADTWDRARAWALWKALIILAAPVGKPADEIQAQKETLDRILQDV